MYTDALPTRAKFVWGDIKKVHKIGRFALIEHLTNRPANATDDWKQEVSFHGYISTPAGWYDVMHSYSTLERGLLSLVIFDAEWSNSGLNAALNERLSGYVFRILQDSQ